MDIPKSFWKYYDLYRRKLLTLEEFSASANIPVDLLVEYLQEIKV